MEYRFHITPEEYKRGEQNGISRRNLYQRVHEYGMPVEEAIKKPLARSENITKDQAKELLLTVFNDQQIVTIKRLKFLFDKLDISIDDLVNS